LDINRIKDPSFLKDMDIKALEKLSADIRRFLIEKLAITGGHFSSNMGVVELTIALHKVFESPKDRLLFDVGHQSYVHKILTGRAPYFDTLRKTDGLSGFLKRKESDHDCFEAGHSSTSIAAAAGMLFAKPFNREIGHVVALIGDGALASGAALEALNFLGHYPEKNPIIILNDNEMSISQNVGHLARTMTRLRMRRSYRSLRNRTSRILPGRIRNFTSKVEKRLKGFLTGHTYFESMGYQYFGPLDGHDFKQLLKVLEIAKKEKKPTVIHVRTVKGKGYEHSENDITGQWHGTPPFCIETGSPTEKIKNGYETYQAITAAYMEKHADKTPGFYVITPAMIGGGALHGFKARHPSRLIDTGIAEATAVTMAGSMALEGVPVFLTIYSTFLQRAYDQVLHDVARQKAPVVIGVDRAGLVGGDGETHQGIYDIPFLSHIPGMTIAHPKDAEELIGFYHYAFRVHKGPIAIRYPRAKTHFQAQFLDNDTPVTASWAEIASGEDGTILAFGEIIGELASIIKEKNLNLRLINARFIKPLDEKTLSTIALDKPLIIHEESTLQGGFGSAVLSYFAESGPMPTAVKLMGFKEAYVPQGERDIMLRRHKLDAQSVIDAWEALMQ